MDASIQHEAPSGAAVANVDERDAGGRRAQGLRHPGGSGKASCGSGGGAGRSADRDLGEGEEPSLLQRGSPSSLCPHARGGGAGLQHPVQLLQSQIRLRQRVAPRRGQREADAGAGRQEGAGGRLDDPADDGARHRRPGRSARQSRKDLQDLRADRQDRARHQALPVDQRAGAARSRRHHRRLQRRSRHHHHQHGRSRDRREDLSLGVLEAQALHRRRGREAADRPAAAGSGDAHRARHPVQGQLGDDPGRQRQASRRGQQGGEIARRVPAQHHAADLGAGARHRVRPHRPARPDGAGTQGAAGQLRRRNEHDAALPPVPRRRGRIARRGSQRRVHHRQDHGDGRQLRSRYAARPIRPRSRKSASPRSPPSRKSWRRWPAR